MYCSLNKAIHTGLMSDVGNTMKNWCHTLATLGQQPPCMELHRTWSIKQMSPGEVCQEFGVCLWLWLHQFS